MRKPIYSKFTLKGPKIDNFFTLCAHKFRDSFPTQNVRLSLFSAIKIITMVKTFFFEIEVIIQIQTILGVNLDTKYIFYYCTFLKQLWETGLLSIWSHFTKRRALEKFPHQLQVWPRQGWQHHQTSWTQDYHLAKK